MFTADVLVLLLGTTFILHFQLKLPLLSLLESCKEIILPAVH
jgi:hypothetical protein